ncbi:MAG: carbohydrate-binding domain-containing protein [Corynebacterium sp.]|nr:carbohydrate-binding domain-containing protein [Corynebacterium sp.]
MRFKKSLTAAVLAASLALTACNADDSTATNETVTSATATDSTNSSDSSTSTDGYDTTNPADASTVLAGNSDATVVYNDEWDASEAQDLNGDEITSGGVYTISGDHGTISVDAADQQVVLILQDANLDGIKVVNADDVVIYLEGESTIDSDVSADDEYGAAIYSNADLTISGDGKLNVNATDAEGIHSKDDLALLSGTVNITAADDGFQGTDSVTIKGGTLNITSGNDGIKSTQTDDDTKGYINISGGDITITSVGDGIDGTSDVIITDGTFNIVSGDGAAAGKTDTSAKGIKATSALVVEGGTFNIDAADDAVHSKGSVRLSAGDFTLATGDDGLHSEVALVLDGADVKITEAAEGIEGGLITISDGNIEVTSDDDGINASGSTTVEEGLTATADESSETTEATASEEFTQGGPGGGGMGQMAPGGGGDMGQMAPGGGMDESTGEQLNITGGTITVRAEGDGIDSNGDLTISGGTLSVFGPTTGGNGIFDVAGTFTLTGGTIQGAGTAAMPQNPTATENQGWLAGNLTGNAGDTITISDANGKEIASFEAEKAYGLIQFSSADITDGETYTISNGTDSVEVTAGDTSSISTGMGGGMPGGMGGQAPGMPGAEMGAAPQD